MLDPVIQVASLPLQVSPVERLLHLQARLRGLPLPPALPHLHLRPRLQGGLLLPERRLLRPRRRDLHLRAGLQGETVSSYSVEIMA